MTSNTNIDIDNLTQEADSIDYTAMMLGKFGKKPVTKEQKKNIQAFNKTYDQAKSLRS